MQNLSVIVGVAGLVLSLATFAIGRLTAARSNGKQEGTLISEVKQIGKDVKEMKNDVSEMKTEYGLLRDRVTIIETKMQMYHREG